MHKGLQIFTTAECVQQINPCCDFDAAGAVETQLNCGKIDGWKDRERRRPGVRIYTLVNDRSRKAFPKQTVVRNVMSASPRGLWQWSAAAAAMTSLAT